MNGCDSIAIDLHVCRGKACVKGIRVLGSAVLDNLAAGLAGERAEAMPTL